MTDNPPNTESRDELRGVWPIPAVYLLHGKGGSPNGTVKKLATGLEQRWPGLEFVRPLLPHSVPEAPAEASVDSLLQMQIPQGALLVGISSGGTVAAKLQEVGRDDLKVMAISSPTWADDVELETRAERRLAFYSSRDEVIASRVGAWPDLTAFARDFAWLDHDTDRHLRYITRVFDWYLEGTLRERINRIRKKGATRQELDAIVWKTMADAPRSKGPWRASPWAGRWPQTFAEIGRAMQAGCDWEDAWSGWGHGFVFTKDPRCLAQEPPSWFRPGRRAMLAGAAEFFAKLYDLPIPGWVEKPEYFLAEMDYYNCVISFGNSEYGLLMPESEDQDYRLRARTPKEMLRRNVIFAARNLTTV